MVKALLEHGADIGGVETASGSTALSLAALTGQAEVAELLLEAGADIDARDFDGRTALFEAALSGHLQVVVILLARGADVHVRDISGRTALTEANVWGEAKVAELLIKSGAHVETTAEEMMHRNWIPDRCGPIDASRTSLELLENH
ncbi:MAG: ankyrin repeat domain-containing protein [Desulfomonilaceae bacterium]